MLHLWHNTKDGNKAFLSRHPWTPWLANPKQITIRYLLLTNFLSCLHLFGTLFRQNIDEMNLWRKTYRTLLFSWRSITGKSPLHDRFLNHSLQQYGPSLLRKLASPQRASCMNIKFCDNLHLCTMDVHSFNFFLNLLSMFSKGFSWFHQVECLHWIFP
jgi:hypothetical protein